jgi:hypothetical protein
MHSFAFADYGIADLKLVDLLTAQNMTKVTKEAPDLIDQ